MLNFLSYQMLALKSHPYTDHSLNTEDEMTSRLIDFHTQIAAQIYLGVLQ